MDLGSRCRATCGLAIFAGLSLFVSSPILAQTSPQVQAAATWLSGQVTASGTLTNEASSIATPLQNHAEAAQSLALFGAVPPALFAAIGAEPDDNTEYLAREVVGLFPAGISVSTQVATLITRQNADGGFGGAQDYASDPLDTAFALLAFKAAGANSPVSAALAYLNTAQASDGSFDIAGRPNTYVTAYVLLALRSWAAWPLLLRSTQSSATQNAWIQNASCAILRMITFALAS